MLQNKNLEIKVLQLQFQERASDIFLSLCSEKQNELHSLVSSLEERYKTLLINADAVIENQREEYITVFFIYQIISIVHFLLQLYNS